MFIIVAFRVVEQRFMTDTRIGQIYHREHGGSALNFSPRPLGMKRGVAFLEPYWHLMTYSHCGESHLR